MRRWVVHWAWLVIVAALSLASGCRENSAAVGSATSTAAASRATTARSMAAVRNESPPGPAVAEALRDKSRLVLERNCGQCHIRDDPTALPGALAVFDLREPDWSARMSDAQLRSAFWRLGEPLPPDGRPSDVSPEERARFQSYVDTELTRRRRGDGGGTR